MEFRKVWQAWRNKEVSGEEMLKEKEIANRAFETDDLPTEEEIQARSAEDKAKGGLIERLEAAKAKREHTIMHQFLGKALETLLLSNHQGSLEMVSKHF